MKISNKTQNFFITNFKITTLAAPKPTKHFYHHCYKSSIRKHKHVI